ncbi:hypothetical protein BDQ17DRAFT_1332251 [Cyathus striatus]|nr:hypothetical protein BDQ17DRAFT_1332251 [Cyathus striatus]
MPELVEGKAHYLTTLWALDKYGDSKPYNFVVLGLWGDLTNAEAASQDLGELWLRVHSLHTLHTLRYKYIPETTGIVLEVYQEIEYERFLGTISTWISDRWHKTRTELAASAIQDANTVWVGVGAYTGFLHVLWNTIHTIHRAWKDGLLAPTVEDRKRKKFGCQSRLVELVIKHNRNAESLGSTKKGTWYCSDFTKMFPDPFEPVYTWEAFNFELKVHLGHLIFGAGRWSEIQVEYQLSKPTMGDPLTLLFQKKATSSWRKIYQDTEQNKLIKKVKKEGKTVPPTALKAIGKRKLPDSAKEKRGMKIEEALDKYKKYYGDFQAASSSSTALETESSELSVKKRHISADKRLVLLSLEVEKKKKKV